jgi:outer membrane receptor protein involved in Fe transport
MGSRVVRPVRSLRAAIRRALIAGAGTTVIVPMVAHADAAGDANSLEEVVVTATRRQENILDVPYSISAISGDTLAESHVQTLSDLSHLIAGLSFVDQGPTSRSFFVLRGINADSTSESPILGSAGTVPPVSTYIGETPLFLSLHIDDLDRVEVLRGPQGTLYGSGSLAGTIRLIPKQPDPGAFAGYVEADAGNLAVGHQWNNSFGGMLNLPFNDISALRITAGREHYAGFIDEPYVVKLGPASTAVNSPVGIPVSGNSNNPLFGPEVFSGVNNADVADVWQTRLAYLFKPDENFSLLVAYYHQNDMTQGVQAVSPYFKGGSVDYPPAQNTYNFERSPRFLERSPRPGFTPRGLLNRNPPAPQSGALCESDDARHAASRMGTDAAAIRLARLRLVQAIQECLERLRVRPIPRRHRREAHDGLVALRQQPAHLPGVLPDRGIMLGKEPDVAPGENQQGERLDVKSDHALAHRGIRLLQVAVDRVPLLDVLAPDEIGGRDLAVR